MLIDLEKYVMSVYSESDLLSLSALLNQLKEAGVTYSGNWLLHLVTKIDLRALFRWATELGKTVTENFIISHDGVGDFVELLI